MTVGSNINPNFPIPGVDQSSRGFRDNFATAKSEIENLQSKSIQLTGSIIGGPVQFGSGNVTIVIPVTGVAANLMAAGSNLSVQFNNNGNIAGSSQFTFNPLTGNVFIGGNLFVGGNTTTVNSEIIQLSETILGGLTAGNILVTNATVSTSTTTGALVVLGGVGIVGTITGPDTGNWSTSGIALPANSSISWAGDTFLSRITNNFLGMVNGTNPQRFWIYNTYTNGSNYEAATIDWAEATNILTIGTQASGSGTLRAVNLTGSQINLVTGISVPLSANTTGIDGWFDTVSNTGGGYYQFGKNAWGGSSPANTNASAVTGIFYTSGSGSQLFTFASSPGQLSLQTDGSLFLGDSITYNPYNANATTAGSLITEGNASIQGSLLVNNTIGSNGISSTGLVSITNTTPSTSNSTGALVVTGGAGVSGNLYVGGNLVVSGNISALHYVNLQVVGDMSVTGQIIGQNIVSNSNITASAATFSGNVQVATINSNGFVIGTSISSSGAISATGTITGANITSNAQITGVTGSFTTSLSSAALSASGALNAATINSNGFVIAASMSSTGAISTTGNASHANIISNGFITGTSISSSGAISAVGTITAQAIVSNSNITAANSGQFGNISITNATTSSSTTTGALIVAGGVGIAGTVTIGGTVTVGGITIGGQGMFALAGQFQFRNSSETSSTMFDVNTNATLKLFAGDGVSPANLIVKNATFSGNTIVKQFTETYSNPTISAGNLNIDLSQGTIFNVNNTSNITTFSTSNAAPLLASSFTLVLTANGNAYTQSWGATVKWPGGIAPILTTTTGNVDILTFATTNGGNSWFGFIAGQAF